MRCNFYQDEVSFSQRFVYFLKNLLEMALARMLVFLKLLTVEFDGAKEQSYLILMDVWTFTPINTAYLPHNIPWSAHGMHFPEDNFEI